MNKEQAIEIIETHSDDISSSSLLGQALNMAIDALKAQLSQEGTTSDMISKFIDGLEEIFADIRERHVDDSVCGLCEYDGAYMGQSGDWCNECPGFNRDDCFKLSDETRKKWTEEIIKALSTIQPESKKGHWIRRGCGLDIECKCSVCGYKDFVEPHDTYWFKRNYCPNCGAKMKGATT